MRVPSVEQGEKYDIAFAITNGPLWFPLDELAMHICNQEPAHYAGFDLYRRCRLYRGSYIIERLLRAGIPGDRIDAYQFFGGEWVKLSRDHWNGPKTLTPVLPPMRPTMSGPVMPLGTDNEGVY